VTPAKKETPAAKRTRLATEVEAEKEAQEQAAILKKQQVLLSVTCGRDTANEAQKALLNEYRTLGHRDPKKQELLKKFLNDKKCQWWQEMSRASTDISEEQRVGLKGYGTRLLISSIAFRCSQFRLHL
jgi:hypothetical protein